MQCEVVRSHIPDYLAGLIEPQTEVAIQNHLRDCSECRQEFEELRALWLDLGAMPYRTTNGSKQEPP